MLIDTHAHLDFYAQTHDLEDVLSRARENGVETIITVGSDLRSCFRSVEIAERYPQVYAALGIHPHWAKSLTGDVLEQLKELANLDKVVAIGEVGLDYYRDLSPRDEQERAFREQIRLAKEVGLPIIVHDRDAHGDVENILLEESPKEVVFHCFSGDREMAARLMERGHYISVAGPVTFKNAGEIVDVVKSIPLERLMLETDSPYLAPYPHRGKVNQPHFLPLISRRIAEIKGEESEAIARATTANALRFFHLD